MTQPPNGQTTFKAIVSDPPWKGFGGERHYDTMTLDQIKAMPIADLMEDNSWCFLWMPNALVLEGEGAAVLRAWGFVPARQFITWFKGFTGLGEPLRNSTEQLLVGRRGKPEIHFRGQPTHLIAPRQSPHSTKPQEQVAIAERLIGPDGLILELFARSRPTSSRWRTWGLEAEGGSDITIPGYPVPSDVTREEAA